MVPALFTPPYSPAEQLVAQLRERGLVVLQASDTAQWSGCQLADLQALERDWADLPPDAYLKDGGRYRHRRHACFVATGDSLRSVPHRAHWQPLEYNALHGGMRRWFAPMLAHSVALPVWQQLLRTLAQLCQTLFEPADAPPTNWFIEAHQFRIDTQDGIGRPTPEGAHRDGVDLVAVFLVGRHDIKGGETRVFEAHGSSGQRFTLQEPWSLLLLDDARTIHETTPIQPAEPNQSQPGWRDTLVLTCRRGSFLGDDAP